MTRKDLADLVLACAKRNYTDAVNGGYTKDYVRSTKDMLLGMACVMCDVDDYDTAHEIMRMTSKLENIVNPV